MSPTLAAIIFGAGIAGCFLLDRGRPRVSQALWIPTIWLFFCSSRSLTQWLGMQSQVDKATAYLEGSPVDRAALIGLQVLALIVIISRARRLGPVLRANGMIGLFFLYAAVSMVWCDYPFVSFKHWIKGIGDVSMILIVLTEPDVSEAVKRLVTRLAFVLVPLSLLFIRYYPMLGRAYSLGGTPVVVGVTTQKNMLGELCDCMGIGLLWRFRSIYNDSVDPKRVRRLVAIGVVLAIIVWLLWMCNSMTSICALGMASGVMLLATKPAFRRSPSTVHIMVAGVLVCTMYALFFQSSGGLISSLGRDPTLTGRTTVWPELIKLVKYRLLGVGYESFWLGPRLDKVWEITGFEINEAHNGYVEVFLTLGWVGVALFGLLIATGYRNVIAAYRRDPDAGSLRIAWFVAPLITGFTEAAFRMMSLPWMIFLLATASAQWGGARPAVRRDRPASQPEYFPEYSSTLEKSVALSGGIKDNG